jgi:hypothetical protein
MRHTTKHSLTVFIGKDINLLAVSHEPSTTSQTDSLIKVRCLKCRAIPSSHPRELTYTVPGGGALTINLETGWARFHGTASQGTITIDFERVDLNRGIGAQPPQRRSLRLVPQWVRKLLTPLPTGRPTSEYTLTLKDLVAIAAGDNRSLKAIPDNEWFNAIRAVKVPTSGKYCAVDLRACIKLATPRGCYI